VPLLISHSIGMWEVATLAREGWNIEVSRVVVHSTSCKWVKSKLGMEVYNNWKLAVREGFVIVKIE
jgi:hypothetical protein